MKTLILASTSVYRKSLLERLHLPFEMISPEVDETAEPGETPGNLALRLARHKALAVAEAYEGEAIIIGSDQVASCEGLLLNKPMNKQTAIKQLASISGKEVLFHTAVCVHNTAARNTQVEMDTTTVIMRKLTRAKIERYLEKEPAFDCVGAFKSEGLGIGLCERIENNDPTALIGLPLIRLTRMLAQAGVNIP